MSLGFITRTRYLELEAKKQVGVLMKEHQTLLGIIARTKGFKLKAQPLRNFTPYKKGPPLVKDDEAIRK
jgi:hypothetical protein